MPIFDQSAYEDMKSEQAITLDAPNTDDRGKWTSASAAEYDALCPARHLRSLAVPEQPHVIQHHGEKPGVKQVHYSMLNAAYVLVNGHPVIDPFPVKGSVVIGTGIPQEIP